MRTDEGLAQLASVFAAGAGIPAEQAEIGLQAMIDHLGITPDVLAELARPKSYFRATSEAVTGDHYETLDDVMVGEAFGDVIPVTEVAVARQFFAVLAKDGVHQFDTADAADDFGKSLDG